MNYYVVWYTRILWYIYPTQLNKNEDYIIYKIFLTSLKIFICIINNNIKFSYKMCALNKKKKYRVLTTLGSKNWLLMWNRIFFIGKKDLFIYK